MKIFIVNQRSEEIYWKKKLTINIFKLFIERYLLYSALEMKLFKKKFNNKYL